MSIINQALKKAQRERRQERDTESWVQSAPLGAAPQPRRRPTLWTVTAMLATLACGAVLLTWLRGPTANLPNFLGAVRPVVGAGPQLQPAQLTKPPPPTSGPNPHALPPAPRPRPTPPAPSAVEPVNAVQLTAARQPAVLPGRYVTQGNDLYRQGRYQDAIAMYQAALALQPDDLKARNNLGTAYMQLAMDERAAAAFEDVLRLDSTYGVAYYNLACLHARAGNVADAAGYLKRAVEIEPMARDWARTDRDFDRVRDAPQFRRHLEP